VDPARCKGSRTLSDPRLAAIPDVHGHAKGEHKAFAEERPIAYSARMLFLWFYHACRRGAPRFMMVSDHINYLTFEDPGAVHTVRRALKLAEAGDLYGAAETAGVDVAHAAVVSQGLRRGMRFAIGAEVDNDPRARPDAQNIVDAMRPDGMLRSVHFLTIEHPEKGPDYQWGFDNPEFRDLYDVVGTERVWELYMAKLLDDIEKLPGHIVGHFYVPANFGHWPDEAKLEQYEDQLLDACAARGMAVEINTRYLYRDNPPELKEKYRTAIARLMRKAKAKNVGIAVGADAHSPKDQGNGFAEILQMLDAAEINELVFPVNGRLARVALRATKEHLQKVKAQEPAPPPGSSISGFGRAELGLPERDEAEAEAEAVAAQSGTGDKTGHDAGPRKRASGPQRATKKPAKETSEREVKPAAADSKAKAADKAEHAPEPADEKPAEKPASKAPAKSAASKTAAPKTPAAKAAAPKAPAAKTPAAKAPKAPAKAKAAAAASAKTAAKPVAKPTAKPAAKTVAKAPAKAAAKSVKTAKTATKKAAAPVKKSPAKAPAVKKTAAAKKSGAAKKAAPKKAAPAKKAAPKKASAARKKVSTPKRAATKKTSSKRR
jgi:HisJ family histidinol phosphate phosphatase